MISDKSAAVDSNNNASDSSTSSSSSGSAVSPAAAAPQQNTPASVASTTSYSQQPAVAAEQSWKEFRKLSGGKKKPYRRTKRPAGYNDKSSITTTTDSLLVHPLNAYDAVLAESQDLLQAASEAQQLGRMKMCSAYLLLLHARLVGLGKRFDKATQHPPKEEAHHHHEATPEKESSPAHTPGLPTAASASSPKNYYQPPEQPPSQGVVPDAAAAALANMLPSNIELDTAMMEHLARAAAELHAARSSRSTVGADDNIHHHSSSTGGGGGGGSHKRQVLCSPGAREFLATTANQRGVTNAATTAVVGGVTQTTANSSSISWTPSQVHRLQAAGTVDPKQIAAQLSATAGADAAPRVEQQVLAYLKQQDDRAKVEAEMNGTTATSSRGNRKPVTTAMNTVPNANCDARALLLGAPLNKAD